MYNDGFNERNNYIRNSVDRGRIAKMGPNNIDSSFAQMNVNSHKRDVETVDTDKVQVIPEVQGKRENFILRNTNMLNARNILRK